MNITIGVLASIIGLCIALYIYHKQHAKKPMMCPRRAPCETVINSPEATTFGLSNSALGIGYYFATLFLFWCIDIGGRSPLIEIPLILLVIGGFAFSLYLIWVQYHKIKQWCVWCLGSAAMATILFVVMLVFFL